MGKDLYISIHFNIKQPCPSRVQMGKDLYKSIHFNIKQVILFLVETVVVSNKWIREEGQMARRLCGLTEDAVEDLPTS